MSALELPRPGSRVRLKGLTTKREYNGLEGTVKESQRVSAEGRLCVALDGSEKELSVKLVNTERTEMSFPVGFPVHALAERDDNETRGVLSMLLEAGADPNIIRCSEERETALHLATSEETVRILLHSGGIKAKWQLTDSKLNTPLHLFAAADNVGAVRLLVDDGAEFGRIALNLQKQSPVELAKGASKAFLEQEMSRRTREREARLLAERQKQKELERMKAEQCLDALQKLCADLRAPVVAADTISRSEDVQDVANAGREHETLDAQQEKLVHMNPHPPSSLLVVGRSGTGKTTVAIERMLLQESQYGIGLNQVFVTMNPGLLRCVEKKFRTLCSRGAGRTVPRSILSATAQDFPLFLDTRQWLSMLLRSVVDPADQRAGAPVQAFLAACAEEDGNGANGVDDDDIRAGQGGPIEIDVSIFTFQMWPRMVGVHRGVAAAASGNTSAKLGAKVGAKGQTVQRSLSASAVFAEIMSIIKGSVAALRTQNGYLSRAEYMALPVKTGAVTGRQNFSTVKLYDLFLKYQELRNDLGYYDLCDVIFAAHAGLVLWKARQGGRELPIHSVLVDEVQDCSQALIKTFMSACSNPNALFLAGDTCQTIAKGVGGFRFQDIRNMFFTEQEEQRARGVHADDARFVNVPTLEQLATNYRSHDGILRCANVLVSLLVELFPNAVDRLRLEESKNRGEAPILLPDVTPLELYTLIHGSDKSKATAEFGANQCIIVRNLETKSKVRIDFPTALVMTVEECKGLEFEDCIIYNFFSDSLADMRVVWMGVLNWVQGLMAKLNTSSDRKDVAVREMLAVLGSIAEKKGAAELTECALADKLFKLDKGNLPAFEPSKHYIVCEEFKALYVSVTRAKSRVVFFDEDELKRAPLFELLERANVAHKMSLLARSKLADEGGTSSLAQASSQEDWRAQGVILFRAQRFEQAAKCFENSNDALEYNEAAACRDITYAHSEGSAASLAVAAETLLSVFRQYGHAVHARVAASCLISTGVAMGRTTGAVYLKMAATVLLKLEKPDEAARCQHFITSGEGGDVLTNSLGVRHSQLMHHAWACCN